MAGKNDATNRAVNRSVKRAIYPGTFDPITFGHIDIIRKAIRIFDDVVVAVAETTGKNTFLDLEERERMCREALRGIERVEVAVFSGLVVDYAKSVGATVMIRGLRAVSDFEYELSLALMNRNLCPDMETMFLLPDHKYLYLSSSMVRQVIHLGGNLSEYVPQNVAKYLIEKFKNNYKE